MNVCFKGVKLIAALHESAFGTKQTSVLTQPMSAFGGKADINERQADVRF
jgi:hypothetical protein